METLFVIIALLFSFQHKTYNVNPQGQTIQQVIDLAKPGDVINLSAGIYNQDIITKSDGITITGPQDAVIVGGGGARVVEINHSNITLKGFTIDGKVGEGNKKGDFREKLLYVIGQQPKKGVSGLKVLNMTIKNSGGECIRLRYFAHNNEVAHNTILNCGIHDFRFNTGKKNGEGIYIGTAPEQLKDGKNPTQDPDQSNHNWIHNNNINTQGNECVDIKEGSSENLVEKNICTGQKDPESGGMDSRGSNNTFRFNRIFGNSGAGVRLGGDGKNDGINNNVYNNVIENNLGGGIKLERIPQKKTCGNTMSGNIGGEATGEFGKKVNPTISCG